MVYLLKIENYICQIHKKSIKHLYIRVSPDGVIKISAPMAKSDLDITQFVLSSKCWIEEKRLQIQANKHLLEKREQETVNKISLNGRTYSIEYVHSVARPHISRQEQKNVLTFKINQNKNSAFKAKFLDAWLREQFIRQMSELTPQYEYKMGVKIHQLRIRKMKTLWGSCNPKARRIWLNTALITKPIELQEYILVHEMVHLFERNHNQRFYKLMDHFLPAWKRYDHMLQKG